MINYTAPVRDMRFLFNELLDGPQIQKIKCYEDFTPEVIDAILEEGAKFTKEVLLPLKEIQNPKKSQAVKAEYFLCILNPMRLEYSHFARHRQLQRQ